MRIFGRKANPQSTSKLPPELKQYYQPSLRSRFRRVGLLILPLITVIVLGCALVGGGLWLAHHFGKGGAPSSRPQISRGNGSTHTTAPEPAPKPAPKPATQPSQPPAAPVPQRPLVNTGPSLVTVLLPVTAMMLSATLFELRQHRAVRH